jgi:hypothetical protein
MTFYNKLFLRHDISGGFVHKRRGKPRLKFDVVVKEKKSGSKGTARNISTEGCFLKREGAFDELLPVGSGIDLILYLPNAVKGINIKGVVMHHGINRDGMGIAFKALGREEGDTIEQFIAAFLDDLAVDEWADVRREYWAEVARLLVKTPPAE